MQTRPWFKSFNKLLHFLFSILNWFFKISIFSYVFCWCSIYFNVCTEKQRTISSFGPLWLSWGKVNICGDRWAALCSSHPTSMTAIFKLVIELLYSLEGVWSSSWWGKTVPCSESTTVRSKAQLSNNVRRGGCADLALPSTCIIFCTYLLSCDILLPRKTSIKVLYI